ncbi:MAG: hypothetical protein ACI8S6_005546 [Myxococcota bacterium]|jgi:hypothetical protein
MRTFLLVLPLLGGCKEKLDDDSSWLLATRDLGADLASGTGFDMADTDALWTATDQLIPGLYWELPALDLATAAFDTMLDDEGVTDPGTCPYTTASGSTLTWVSNCRSQDGYQLDGTVSYTDGDDDEGRDWRLWEFDLEVAPREEFSDLQRVMLRGQVLTTTGSGDDALISALQLNVHIGIEEYFEAANGDAVQETIWADWRLSARYEQHTAEGGVKLLMEGTADLGALGGLEFSGTDLLLPKNCPNEIDGTLSIGGGELRFDGSGGCDRCGELTLNDATSSVCPG